MKFDKLYKKVIDAQRAFEERHIPISLDFKIEDLRDALVEANDLIEKLKQKLEDAGMRERRLKRALWLSRTDRAKECKYKYETWERHEESKVYKDRDTIAIVGRKARTWGKVEHKCLKKAEEYK